MKAAKSDRHTYTFNPTIGELLVATGECLALGRKAPTPEKAALVLTAGQIFLEVQRHLERIGHPDPEGVISALQPRIRSVMEAKAKLDREVDGLLFLYQDADGRGHDPHRPWPVRDDG